MLISHCLGGDNKRILTLGHNKCSSCIGRKKKESICSHGLRELMLDIPNTSDDLLRYLSNKLHLLDF